MKAQYTLRMKDQIYNTFVVDNKNCNELYCIEISMNEVRFVEIAAVSILRNDYILQIPVIIYYLNDHIP